MPDIQEIIDYLYDFNVNADITIEEIAEDIMDFIKKAVDNSKEK